MRAIVIAIIAGWLATSTPSHALGPGSVVVARDDTGVQRRLRIDAVEIDPRDPDRETVLYTVSVDSGGSFTPLCLPDREGNRQAIALQGRWNASREHVDTDEITFACTNGAIAKCVRFGYKPWKELRGQSLAPYHQACVHAVPADYCGDGRAHTRNGTPIQIYDNLGIQRREPTVGARFEAAWSARGAAVVERLRYGGQPLAEVFDECPSLIHAPHGDPQQLLTRDNVLLITESFPNDERP